MKVLAKEHTPFSANFSGGTWTIDSFVNGWRILNPAGIFCSSEYFDLAGMSQREKTLFFEAATVQDVLNPTATSGAPGDSLIQVDLMCTTPLDDASLQAFYLYANLAYQGTGNNALTFDQTVYARVNQFVITNDLAPWGSFELVASNQLGSLNATASDRIYSYRILVVTRTGATDIDVFGCRHMLSVDAKEEPDFQYLMRLRRSYELQQSYDED